MKRLLFILCIITFLFFLSACRTVNITPANELLANRWEVKNPNFVSAKLEFDPAHNQAVFIITDEKGESTSIDGIFAVDEDNLYITSDKLFKTYTFGYKVYKDRLILTYNNTELTLNAEKEKEP